jgi:predicted O-linked N-acetylglucosamine transferase (SPINDLY family)
MKMAIHWLVIFLLISFQSKSASASEETESSGATDDLLDAFARAEVESLEREALSLSQGSPAALKLWKRILSLNPRSGNANIQLGMHGMTTESGLAQERAFQLLEKSYDPNLVDRTIPMPSRQGGIIAQSIGRYRWERREYELARRFIGISAKSSAGPNLFVCAMAQISTMLDPFPNSTKHADESVEAYYYYSSKFLADMQTHNWVLDDIALSQSVPGAKSDPFAHCMLSIFHLSFYYRADVARAANARYNIAKAIWPQLNYVPSKYYKLLDNKSISSSKGKPCRDDGRIRLGVISGCLSIHHSVVADFSGVLGRLDRSKFSVTYIYLQEQDKPIDKFVYANPDDTVLILEKQSEDSANGAWVTRYHSQIEALDLDILYYLDLTMSNVAQRLAMAKLAKVQVVSHGHPVTSGIPSEIMDYYISWEAAELDYQVAKTHYTEELVFLPKETLHQYYTERSRNSRSLLNGRSYLQLVKDGRNAAFGIPADGHWYVCMQIPHKFGPEMDPLICNILTQDPLGRVVLHEVKTPVNQELFLHRLSNAGCDMERVHFLPSQPHHRLLALYELSDVVLDSYPAGGCTTTRELLELSKVVVTLPARLLGGRWTYAYYQIIGDETLNEMVIAKTEQEYVELAVMLGTDEGRRKEAERRIGEGLYKLYRRDESVMAWEKVLIDIAPVRLPIAGRICEDDDDDEESGGLSAELQFCI